MLSTCPSCLSQVLHDDSLSEVKCECGEHFSPFLTVAEHPDLGSGVMAMSQKLQNDIAGGKPEFADYTESESVFADIRSFGESLDGPDNSQNDLKVSAHATNRTPQEQNHLMPMMEGTMGSSVQMAKSPTAVGQAVPVSDFASNAQLMTSGDSIPGYTISGFLTPISVWCNASATDEDPLQAAFQSLWNRAIQVSANGIVGIHWSFTPDGTRILLSGTPVQCQKNP